MYVLLIVNVITIISVISVHSVISVPTLQSSLPADSRRLADTYYHLGVALGFYDHLDMYAEAIKNFEEAILVINKRCVVASGLCVDFPLQDEYSYYWGVQFFCTGDYLLHLSESCTFPN